MDIQKTYYFVNPLAAARKAIDREAHKGRVLSALKNDWASVKLEYQTLKRSQAAAAARSGSRWDYPRLSYEQSEARRYLENAPSVGAIQKQYAKLERDGDTHKLLAFVREGVTALQDKNLFDQNSRIEALPTLQDMRRMENDLTQTQEEKDLAKQGEILTGKIAEIYQATQEARNLFPVRTPMTAMNSAGLPAYSGNMEEISAFVEAGGTRDVFGEMLYGVEVYQHVDPQTMYMKTQVNVNWE